MNNIIVFINYFYDNYMHSNYQPLARSGYFREEVPRSSDPVCVVTDPTANFKWHSLHCGGPEVASFVCELPGIYIIKFIIELI